MDANRIAADEDVNFIALVKDTERYVFSYRDGDRDELSRTFGRFASNPELSFTWYDAAAMSQRVREIGGKAL